MRNFSQIKADFERDGVVKIPGVFNPEEVRKMKAEGIASLLYADRFHPRVSAQIKMENGAVWPALSFFPAVSMQYLNQIRCDRRLSNIVLFMLGENVKQLNNQFYFRLPGDGDEFEWHQDILFRTPKEDFPGIESRYLQTAIALDEITEESGAVEYVLGSHKQGDLNLLPQDETTPDKLRSFDRSKFQGVKMTAKPGDLMIWSVMIVHGSEQNKSNTSRMVYMNGFAASDASKNFPHYLIDGHVVPEIDTDLIPLK